jgi:hypothetical protein
VYDDVTYTFDTCICICSHESTLWTHPRKNAYGVFVSIYLGTDDSPLGAQYFYAYFAYAYYAYGVFVSIYLGTDDSPLGCVHVCVCACVCVCMCVCVLEFLYVLRTHARTHTHTHAHTHTHTHPVRAQAAVYFAGLPMFMSFLVQGMLM